MENLNLISENNNTMINSYLMIDPQGRFYQNRGNLYKFSKKILKVGVLNALNEIEFNFARFIERGGFYNWSK